MKASRTANGSFVAPDHEYPAHLELRLTAADSGGLTRTVNTLLYPQTVQLGFASQPSGLSLTVGSASQPTPFVRTVITGSTVSVSANSPQAMGGQTYGFLDWSDGGTQTHTIVANNPATLTATFRVEPTKPDISNVVIRPGPGRVTIEWRTNQPTDGRIEYGPTPAYGSTTPHDRELSTQHSVPITGLDRKTTYHLRILSSDDAGNLASWTGSFKTK